MGWIGRIALIAVGLIFLGVVLFIVGAANQQWSTVVNISIYTISIGVILILAVAIIRNLGRIARL